MQKGRLKRVVSIILALALITAFSGMGDISNVYAAAGVDVGVISVNAANGAITATLFNYSYADDAQVTEISYYIDGKRVSNDKVGATVEKRAKKTVSANVDLDLSKKHNYTVNITVKGDGNHSNNNRTAVVSAGRGEETTTKREEPTTVKEPETETTIPVGDTGKLSISSVVKPDISELTVGAKCKLKAKIKNSTSGSASGKVQFYVDNQYVGEIAVSQLAAGAEQEVELEWTVTYGNHDIKVVTQTSTAQGSQQTDEKSVHVDTIHVSGEHGSADLVVTDIIWNPTTVREGTQTTFTAVVKNQGTATTVFKSASDARIGVLFQVDGTSVAWSDTFVHEIGPGQSVYLTANNGPNGTAYWTATGTGSHTVTAWVDDQKRVNQSSYDNDKYDDKSLYVANAIPVEVPDGDKSGGTVKAFGTPAGKGAASGIAVKVENQEVGIFNTTVNNSRIWDQYRYQDTPVSIFEFSGTVTVRIVVNKTLNSSTVVRPLSAGVTPKIVTENGINYVEFKLSKNGTYTVEFNGETEGALQLIANPITQEPTGNVIRVSSGTSRGETYVGSGQTLYIEGGAAVYGRITLGSNAKVVGSGILEPGGAWGNISLNITGVNNSSVEGITVVNPPSWIVECRDSSYITFNYFHILSATPNSDGISIQSSNHVTINNGYYRTWDDGVVLKNYSAGNYTNNVSVNNCVFWTDLAQSMEIGAETNKGSGGGPTIYTAHFTDIDVIHAFHKPAISIHNCDNATVSDVIWKNVTVEDAQMGNNHGYGDGWPILIDITNIYGGEVDGTAGGWTTVGGRGIIDNVTLENIKLLQWENDWSGKSPNGKAPGIRIRNSERGGTITNIKINGLKVGEHNIRSVSDINQYMYSYTDGTSNKDKFFGFDYNNQLKFN